MSGARPGDIVVLRTEDGLRFQVVRGDLDAGEPASDGLAEVRAPLLGTFYRAPAPGAPPFVEVGSQVEEDNVVGIVETMKLMNSVLAGVSGTVAEICLGNAQFAEQDAVLLRIEPDGP